MPKKTQVSKMPAGKMQFGIVVPFKIHTLAKHIAADENIRISDAYAKGIEIIADARNSDRDVAAETEMVRYLTRDLGKDKWEFFKALSDFFRGNPREDQVGMLRLILGKYLPEESKKPSLVKANG